MVRLEGRLTRSRERRRGKMIEGGGGRKVGNRK